MEASAPEPVDACPPVGDVRRELSRLGLLAAAVFAAVAAAVGYVGLVLERRDEFSLFATFSGWQLDVAETVLALLVLGVGLGAGRRLVRRYGSLRGRTSHRRAVVLAALLPGLLAGGITVIPMRAAFTWASDHTAAAASARHKYAAWLASYHKAPPPAAAASAAAPASLAARMLHPSDLGTHWYDAVRPNPTVARLDHDAATSGEVAAARDVLTKQHWSGRSWALDHMLLETQRRFSTAAAATRYLTTVWARAESSPEPCCAVTFNGKLSRRIARVTVLQRDATTGFGTRREAAFVVGDTVFTISLDMKPTTSSAAADYERALAGAVSKARNTI